MCSAEQMVAILPALTSTERLCVMISKLPSWKPIIRALIKAVAIAGDTATDSVYPWGGAGGGISHTFSFCESHVEHMCATWIPFACRVSGLVHTGWAARTRQCLRLWVTRGALCGPTSRLSRCPVGIHKGDGRGRGHWRVLLTKAAFCYCLEARDLETDGKLFY